MKIIAFGIAGLLSAVAGLMLAGRFGSISNQMGTGYVIMSLAGAILGGVNLFGGRGTAFGMLGGALLLGMFDNVLNLLAVNVYLVTVIKGLLILFAIMLDAFKTRWRIYILSQDKVRRLKELAHAGTG